MPSPSHRQPEAATAPWELPAVALMTIVGALLRVIGLGERALWTDELMTLVTARRTLGESLTQLQDYAAPVYQLLVRPWLTDGYASEATLRAPACLFGVLLIPATWWLGRMLFGPLTAAIAAGVVTLNPQLVYYSREARPYTLFVLGVVVASAFVWRYAASDRRSDAIGWVLACVVLAYSQFLGVFYVAATVAWYAIDRGMRRALPLGAVILALVAPAAWLASRYTTSGAAGLSGWVPESDALDVLLYLGDLLGIRQLGILVAIPLIAAVWAGRTAFDRGREGSWWLRRREVGLVWTWVLAGPVLLGVLSEIYRPVLIPRYFLPCAVGAGLLAVAYLAKTSRGALALMVALWAFGITYAARPDLWEIRDTPSGLRELAGELQKQADAGTEILIADWPFTEGFVNPELAGLRYYGLTAEIERIPVTYPPPVEVLDISAVPLYWGSAIVAFDPTRLAVGDALAREGLGSSSVNVQPNLWVFSVRPAGSTP